MRSLLTGPSAPTPSQLVALGSRNALSPRRATALMRQALGQTEVSLPAGARQFGHIMHESIKLVLLDSLARLQSKVLR